MLAYVWSCFAALVWRTSWFLSWQYSLDDNSHLPRISSPDLQLQISICICNCWFTFLLSSCILKSLAQNSNMLILLVLFAASYNLIQAGARSESQAPSPLPLTGIRPSAKSLLLYLEQHLAKNLDITALSCPGTNQLGSFHHNTS